MEPIMEDDETITNCSSAAIDANLNVAIDANLNVADDANLSVSATGNDKNHESAAEPEVGTGTEVDEDGVDKQVDENTTVENLTACGTDQTDTYSGDACGGKPVSKMDPKLKTRDNKRHWVTKFWPFSSSKGATGARVLFDEDSLESVNGGSSTIFEDETSSSPKSDKGVRRKPSNNNGNTGSSTSLTKPSHKYVINSYSVGANGHSPAKGRKEVQRAASCKEPRRKESFKLKLGDLRNGSSTKDNHSPPQSPGVISMATPIPIVQDGKFSMMEFALLFFRESLDKYEMMRAEDGSIRGSIKMIESLKLNNLKRKKSFRGKLERAESWTWSEQANMIKWTGKPIKESLLRLHGSNLNNLALECFESLMQYMGDLPLFPGDTALACAFRILKNCHMFPELRDEVYCQLCKQTTNNKSDAKESCMRGWRLFGILTNWFNCSDILRQYLIKYLQQNASDPARTYYAAASFSLTNLRKTMKYGGRKNVPSAEEIEALTAGRGSKRHQVICPGGIPMTISVRPCTVVQDIIEDICGVLKIKNHMEMDEFALFSILEGDDPEDNAYSRLKRSDYLMDVITDLTLKERTFHLLFQRTSWFYPVKFDQPDFLEMMYAQCLPDYVDGYLLMMEKSSINQKMANEIAKLAALQHRASNSPGDPTLEDIQRYIPGRLLTWKTIKPQQWLNEILKKLADIRRIDPLNAKSLFMDILSRWPLFGSVFFEANCPMEPRIGGHCSIAINRAGLHFLKHKTHEVLLSYPFNEIISTKKIQDRTDDSDDEDDCPIYLDIKVGNSMVQKIVKVKTDHAVEIAQLIGQYITAINKTTPQN